MIIVGTSTVMLEVDDNDKSAYDNVVHVFIIVCLHLTLMTNLRMLILHVFLALLVFA